MDVSTLGFKKDPGQFFQIMSRALAVQDSISFWTIHPDIWNIMSMYLPAQDLQGLLKNLDVTRFIVEQYASVKVTIVNGLDDARTFNNLPFVSLNVDLYTKQIQNIDYVAI